MTDIASDTQLQRVIGLSLPANEELVVRAHPSYYQDSPEARRRALCYADLGRLVIQTVFALRLYLITGNESTPELSRRAATAPKSVATTLYSRLSLRDLQLTGRGTVQGVSPMDISLRLAAAVYRTHGLLAVNKLLSPYPIASAADSFRPNSAGKPRSMEQSRAEALRAIATALGMRSLSSTETLLLDQALTHRSFRAQHPNQPSNEALVFLGRLALNLYGTAYSLERGLGASQASQLTATSRIVERVPESLTNELRVERSRLQGAKSSSEQLKVDAFKAVLAALLLTAVRRESGAVESNASRLAYSVLEGAASKAAAKPASAKPAATRVKATKGVPDSPAPRYARLTSKVVSRFWPEGYHVTSKQIGDRSSGATLFSVAAKVQAERWSASSMGTAPTEAEAKERAAQELLPMLLAKCPDKALVAEIEQALSEKNAESKATTAPPAAPRSQAPQQATKAPQPKRPDWSTDRVVFDAGGPTLYICRDAERCSRRGHNLINVTGVLGNLQERPVSFTVTYCPSCKKYYITKGDFHKVQEKHGPLLGDYRFPSSGRNWGQGYGALKEESVLMRYGYSVNKQDGLSPMHRRLILANILDRRIATKDDVMRLLRFFMGNAGSQKEKRDACSKWRHDLEWVRDYQIDPQRRSIVKI